jgi:hypothetical protein
VHRLYSAVPRLELREYVRAFAQREVSAVEGQIVQAIPAYLEQIIEFEFADRPRLEFGDGQHALAHQVSAVGLSAYRPANIVLSGEVVAFGIFFQPMAFQRLFRIPTSELTNTFCDCSALLGTDIDHLWYEMAQHPSFEKRVQFVEAFLLKKSSNAVRNSDIARAALFLVENSGMLRVDRVANYAALCVRQFERRFASEVGISPKV